MPHVINRFYRSAQYVLVLTNEMKARITLLKILVGWKELKKRDSGFSPSFIWSFSERYSSKDLVGNCSIFYVS